MPLISCSIKLELDYEIGSQNEIYPDRVVILGGGGNLVRPYPNVISFLRRNLGKWKQLVILPHTIRDYEEIIGQLDSNCTLFCREPPSLEFVKRVAPKVNAFLAPDVTLECNFDLTKQEMRAQGLIAMRNKSLLLRNSKRLARALCHKVANFADSHTLNAYRADIEKTVIKLPKNNFDLSQAFAADDMFPLSSLHATYFMMKFIERFGAVSTNRLHVGIMSAMLGKDVDFYDNAYGKNRDVFFYCLRDRFQNIRWRDA